MKGKLTIISGFPGSGHGNRVAIWLPEKNDMVFYVNGPLSPPSVWLGAAEDIKNRKVADLGEVEVPDEYVQALLAFAEADRDLRNPENEIKCWIENIAAGHENHKALRIF